MTLDAPYQETDRVSPHYGHTIQPLDDVAWVCVTCQQEDELRAAIEREPTVEGKTLAKLKLGAHLWDRLMAKRAAKEDA